MEIVADLHLHSKYSRAVSRDMILPTMALWGKKKGINLLTTGDFTHPLWFREIKAQLEEVRSGVFQLKSQDTNSKKQTDAPEFILTVEVSSIYTQNGKLRRIHNLLFAPSLEAVEKVNQELLRRGCNISSDGRPIFGLSSRQVLELALAIDRKIILIPCHAWTPHFGIYGSASGFDSIEECFEDLSKYVYGIETGISSDPFMNWQIPELQNRSILSFSDAHSPAKMGREATVFNLPLNFSYNDIGRAIAKPMKKQTTEVVGSQNAVDPNIAYTIEFYPEEGKYHYTGHRNCGVAKSPSQIRKDGAICPVCKKRLTEGVMFRVQQVAGREVSTDEPRLSFDEAGVGWIKDQTGVHPPFVKLVPLLEIAAESLGSTVMSDKAKNLFSDLCKEFGSELSVLLKTPVENIAKTFGEKVAEGVLKVRKGDIAIEPGFDGEYGKVKIWSENAKKEQENNPNNKTQLGLF